MGMRRADRSEKASDHRGIRGVYLEHGLCGTGDQEDVS
jgi:hypothetical protein